MTIETAQRHGYPGQPSARVADLHTPLAWTFIRRVFSSSRGTTCNGTWPEFVTLLREPRQIQDKLDGPLFVPAIFRGGRRLKEKAISLSLLALDFDNKNEAPVTIGDALNAVAASKLAAVLYTTARSTLECPRFRLVLPLAAPVPAEAWSRWLPVAIRDARLSKIEHGAEMSTSKSVAQGFFLPAAIQARQPKFFELSGKALDVAVPPEPAPPPRPIHTPAAHQSGCTRYGAAALANASGTVMAAPIGSRHRTLYAQARGLAELAAGGELARELIAPALMIAANAAGLADGEAKRTIRDGILKGASSPRSSNNGR